MIFRVLIALLFIAPFASAQQAPVAPKYDVSVELRCLSLPHELGVSIVRKLQSPKPDDKAAGLEELDALLAKGTAILHGWPMVTMHNGLKGTAENIEEIRYATGFEAGQLNRISNDQNGPSGLKQEQFVDGDVKPLATSFETRNTGVTLEVEPIVREDGKSAELNFVAQHVRLQSIDRMTIEHENTTEKKVNKVIQEQPRFATMKVMTAEEMKNGEQRLVGLFTVPGGQKLLELFLLRLEIHAN